jgi:hypothetical protein
MGLPDKYRLLLCIVLFASGLSAQKTDSLPPATDTLLVKKETIRLAKQSFSDEITYGAADSMYFDIRNKQLHLWGSAYVRYTTLDIKAGYIRIDYANNEVWAEPFPDTSGQMKGLPSFKDATQSFTAQKLRYNFKSEKGVIQEVRTKQEDLYVLSEKAKFIGTQGDTAKNNIFFNKNALITTCDAEHPHFGIRSRKQKVVPGKIVVTGLSNLEVAGVPTPLVLPFGFYPNTTSRKAGLIIPRDFEFADAEGLGIKQFGWYQPINEHIDVTAQFNVYVSGSFGVRTTTRYIKRYGYNGNLELEFNRRARENNQAQKISTQSFGVRLSHNQDAKAHPTRKFGGTVNLQTNNNQSINNNDFNNVYQNTLNSNLNYSQSFPGKPYALNAGFTHSQNTQTRLMNVTFPTATFTVQRIYPFKRKEQVGKEQWYEKISFRLTSQLQNTFSGPDTSFFTEQTLQTARMGVRHAAESDLNFKVFKYINVAPRISYEENWYPYTVRRELLDEIRYQYDTIRDPENPNIILDVVVDSAATRWGIDTTFRKWEFAPFRTYEAGISAGTALFFTKRFKSGWFRGIRHTMKPSVSTGFGPNFSNPRYDYFRTYNTDLRPEYNDTLSYNIFQDGVYGKPASFNRDITLNYSILNILEFKHRSKRDTITGLKKVRIFDNLTFSGNYSLSRDTLKWSTISTGGLFRLLKGVSQLTWNVTFDPYILNENGIRVNRFTVNEEGKLVRVANLGVALNTNFSVGQLRDVFKGKGIAPPQPPPGGYDDLLGWFEQFRVSHRIGWTLGNISGTNRDTLRLSTNNISLSGNIPISSKWLLNVGNISYDFPSQRIVYPDFGVTRDLHCWQITLRWQPQRGTYELFINAKPGTLDFLKMPYRKNNLDGRAVF